MIITIIIIIIIIIYIYIYMAAGQNLLLCNKEGFLQAGATRSII